MTADTLGQIVVQVPALALISFVFLRVLTIILNEQGRRIDKMADSLSKLSDSVQEMARRCPAREN